MFLELDPRDIARNYGTMADEIQTYRQGQADYAAETEASKKTTYLQRERDLREYIAREKTVLTLGGIAVAALVITTIMFLPRIKRT